MPIFKTGVEIPPINNPIAKRNGTRKYAWINDWKIGDMIELSTEREMFRVDAAVRKYGIDDKPAKLVRRKVEENGQTFYRLWRVE